MTATIPNSWDKNETDAPAQAVPPTQTEEGSGSVPSEEREERHTYAAYNDKNVFTKKEKWLIVAMTALAAFFSPLTANVYFPVIPTLAVVFGKTTELINLTVVMYLLLQAIAPMVWGTLSDNFGRRPITLACLLVLSLSCVGLALVPTSAYWLLMVLRCLQAAGSASTIAVGAGVISDISTPEERGGFFGFFVLGPMVGPSFGPVMGGALAQGLGWRSIFWFVCIAATTCLIIIAIIMPETLPAVRYKKDKMSKLIYTPIIPVVGRKKKGSFASAPQSLPPKKPFQNPLKLFAKLDIVFLLIISALICAVFNGILASISTLFDRTYDFLDETKIGLCFLAFGGGMAIGSAINGKLLDKWYSKEKRLFAEKLSANLGKNVDMKNIGKSPDFPLERARLSFVPFLVIILAACTAGYGWALEKRASIAIPLILQIIMGYMCIGIMNVANTIMIDLAPDQGSAVTACNNLIRCLLSAGLVAVIEPIFKGIGVGWTYVLLTGITLAALPAIFLELKFGPRIRAKRLRAAAENR